jgi:predicted nuclease of predicted toxin-antitoxin system
MKLLLDANLSWRLVKKLANDYEVVEHVTRSGLPIPASDLAIWQYAHNHDFIIVTNDEDFANLLILRGAPPKIVLLRKGNLTTNLIADLLISKKEDIQKLNGDAQFSLLGIY